jgi:hypothetical protein
MKLKCWSVQRLKVRSPTTPLPMIVMWHTRFSAWWFIISRLRIRPALVLRPFVLHISALRLFANSHQFLICDLLYVGFNAFWLAGFYYFWSEHHFWFTPSFSGTQLGRKIRNGCMWNVTPCSSAGGTNVLEETYVSVFRVRGDDSIANLT